VLEHWRELLPKFVKVIPVEYKKVLLLRSRREQDEKHTARQEMAAHG
jgi:glutamate synthase domain-containing protein 3